MNLLLRILFKIGIWTATPIMFVGMFIDYATYADAGRSLAIFLLGSVWAVFCFQTHERLKNQPRRRRRPVAPSAIPVETDIPLPQTAKERRFALPPGAQVAKPAVRAVSPSMSPKMRRFIEDGKEAMRSNV